MVDLISDGTGTQTGALIATAVVLDDGSGAGASTLSPQFITTSVAWS